MADPIFMKVFDAWKDLLEEFASLFFIKSLPFHYIVKEFAATGILHYQKQLPICLNDLI
jgi:hypothetical protein